jgi:hypothetical protein
MNKVIDDTDEVRRIINDKMYYINNIKIDFTTLGMYKAYEILLSPCVLEHSIVNLLEQMLISSVSCNIQKYSINKDNKKELITNTNTNSTNSNNSNNSYDSTSSNGRSSRISNNSNDDSYYSCFHNGSIMIECIHTHSTSTAPTVASVASLSYAVGGGSSLLSSSSSSAAAAINQSVGWDKINIYIGTYFMRCTWHLLISSTSTTITITLFIFIMIINIIIINIIIIHIIIFISY